MEIDKPVRIIELSNKVQVTIYEEKVPDFLESLKKNQWVKVGDNIINTSFIVGIFTPQTINKRQQEKAGKGYWYCDKHPKYRIPLGNKCGYCYI